MSSNAAPTPRETIRDRLAETAIVAIVRETDEHRARAIALALRDAGARSIELTAPTPGCFAILAELARTATPPILGVGTILEPDDVLRAADSGASFAVSPHTDPNLIDAAHRAGLVAIPGALTPTEVLAAHRAGADVIKLFPISAVGGARFVRDLRGPLPDLRLWASGGVALEDVGELIGAGVSIVGLTSALTADTGPDPRPALEARLSRANEAVQVARQGRWLLHVRGPLAMLKVGRAELRALPKEEHVLLEELVPGRRGQAVRIRRLLAEAGITTDDDVEVTSSDGAFRRKLPAKALLEGGVLHHATGGQALDRSAGGPLRLYIAGGAAGCDNVKAVAQINLVPARPRVG